MSKEHGSKLFDGPETKTVSLDETPLWATWRAPGDADKENFVYADHPGYFDAANRYCEETGTHPTELNILIFPDPYDSPDLLGVPKEYLSEEHKDLPYGSSEE